MGKAKKDKAGSKAKGGSKSKSGSKGKAEKSASSKKGTPSKNESSASQEQSSNSEQTSSELDTSAGDTTVASKSDRVGDGKTDATWPPPLNRPMLPFLVLPADVEMPSLQRQPSPIITRDCSNVWFYPVALIAVAAIVTSLVVLSRTIQHIDSRTNQDNATGNGTSSENETSSEIESLSDWFRTTGAVETDESPVTEDTRSQPSKEWSTKTKSPEAAIIGQSIWDKGPFTTGSQRASQSLETKDWSVFKETASTSSSWSTQESPPRPKPSGTISHHGPHKKEVLVTNGPQDTAGKTAINNRSTQ